MMHEDPVPDQKRQDQRCQGTLVRAQQVAPYTPDVGQQAETSAEIRYKVASAAPVASLASRSICKTAHLAANAERALSSLSLPLISDLNPRLYMRTSEI